MRIHKVEINNLRGIQKMELLLNGKNAVFIGINGAGKSTILDCLAILLSRFVASLSGSGRRYFVERDITFGKRESLNSITINFEDIEGSWQGGKSHKGEPKLLFKMNQFNVITEKIRKDLYVNKLTSLPLIVYYPVNRIVLDIPLRIKKRHEFDQISAYENSLTSGTDFRVFFEWYRNREDLENENKARLKKTYEDKQLKAVRQAIYSFLPGFTNLRVTRNPLRMVITKKSKNLEINQLSNGEKSLLALVGDLARRLAIANPGLGNPLEGKGIVLIDEIELHLHPSWQRSVIPLLESTFPGLQFIITTHSPQVLGELKNMLLYYLGINDKGIYVNLLESPYGRDSNWILQHFMREPERKQEIRIKITKLFDAIISEDWDIVGNLKNQLEEEIGVDEPELIKADVLIRRRRSIKK